MFTFHADGPAFATDELLLPSMAPGKVMGIIDFLELEFAFGEQAPFPYIQKDFEVDEQLHLSGYKTIGIK